MFSFSDSESALQPSTLASCRSETSSTMRLLQRLQDDVFELSSFDNEQPPPYAILSHTWTERQEVTYDKLVVGARKDKLGYAKLRFCAEQAAANGIQYF